MKLKYILIIISLFLIIFYINKKNFDNKIYYVNIDSTKSLNYNIKIKKELQRKNKLEKYINSFSKKDYRTTDLIRDIKDNIKINNQTIQNALIKADVLTIYIGINDINYKISNNNKEEIYKYTDQVINDIENLFKLLRIYCKEEIFIIGFSNNQGISYDEYFEYTNKRLEEICKLNKIKFINSNNISKTILNSISIY